MDKSTAIIITGGFLDTSQAKTAHGLIRGTDRFSILAIIDDKNAGKDAGEVLDKTKRDIPIYSSITEFVRGTRQKPRYCIIGVATKGGVIPQSLRLRMG